MNDCNPQYEAMAWGEAVSAPFPQTGLGSLRGAMISAAEAQALADREAERYRVERKAEKLLQVRSAALDAAIRSMPCGSPKDIRAAAEEFADFLMKDTP